MTLQAGTVRFFNIDRGFGFITPDAAGPDIFVHVSSLHLAGLYALTEGDRVEFDLRPSRSKPGMHEACDVRKLGSAPKKAVRFGDAR